MSNAEKFATSNIHRTDSEKGWSDFEFTKDGPKYQPEYEMSDAEYQDLLDSD